MALTDLQRADVRRFLGFADQTTGFYSRLEGAMAILTPNGESRVIEILDRLVRLEGMLFDALTCLKFTKVEDVTIDAQGQIMTLRQEGNRYARHMGTILGVGVQQFPFHSGGQSGQAGRI